MSADFAHALDDGTGDYATAADRDRLNAATAYAARRYAARTYSLPWADLSPDTRRVCVEQVAWAVQIGWEFSRGGRP
ncbi:MAG TPA: hypothetical protein VFJ14_06770 [Nocardioidaceae bacterium]|nr:hypothetical protein [Nocardioidaceae bacterium]